jgi:hypothetical protein
MRAWFGRDIARISANGKGHQGLSRGVAEQQITDRDTTAAEPK